MKVLVSGTTKIPIHPKEGEDQHQAALRTAEENELATFEIEEVGADEEEGSEMSKPKDESELGNEKDKGEKPEDKPEPVAPEPPKADVKKDEAKPTGKDGDEKPKVEKPSDKTASQPKHDQGVKNGTQAAKDGEQKKRDKYDWAGQAKGVADSIK